MADIVAAFPAHIALDGNNRLVDAAEAYVYATTDTTFSSPLAITDLQGVPFTGGKLVASNNQYPEFRAPAGVLQVYAKSGTRVTLLTSISVYAAAAIESATLAAGKAADAETARAAAAGERAAAAGFAAAAQAVGDTNDAIIEGRIKTPGSKTELALRDKIDAAIADIDLPDDVVAVKNPAALEKGTWAAASYPDAIKTTDVAPATPAADINLRPLNAPRATPSSLNGSGARVGGIPRSRILTAGGGVDAGRVNSWQETEGLDYTRIGVLTSPAGAAVDRAATITVDGIKLAKMTGSNFNHRMVANIGSPARDTFQAGNDYLVSFFVWLQDSAPRRIAVGSFLNNGSDRGHQTRVVEPGVLTRLWTVVRCPSDAPNQRSFQVLRIPTIGWTADSSSAVAGSVSTTISFLQTVDATTANPLTVYAGGFQIEKIPGGLSKLNTNGIIVIGDSTMDVDSGNNDSPSSTAPDRYLASLLNANTFNRAHGGESTQQIRDRYAAEVTPIAASAAYLLWEGIINDSQLSDATWQALVTEIAGWAATDGLIFVPVTSTPWAGYRNAQSAAGNILRKARNEWLKKNFPLTIDVGPRLADPFDENILRRDPTWYGDGVHYNANARRMWAEVVAASSAWSQLPKPSPYQPVSGATFDATPSALFLTDQTTGARQKITVTNGVVSVTPAPA